MPQGVARIPSAEEWVLTKQCTRCGEIKPWAQFPPRKYWPDGRVRLVTSHCSKCGSAMSMERRAKWRAERSPQWERIQKTKLEWQRKKRRAIAAERNGGVGGDRLPVEPIRGFIQRRLDEGMLMREIAEVSQVPERAVNRLLYEHAHVSLRLADAIATRLGIHLYDLYPELLEEAA